MWLRTKLRASLSSPYSLMATELAPRIFLGSPSLSYLHWPTHFPRSCLSSTWRRGIPFCLQRAVMSFEYFPSSVFLARTQRIASFLSRDLQTSFNPLTNPRGHHERMSHTIKSIRVLNHQFECGVDVVNGFFFFLNLLFFFLSIDSQMEVYLTQFQRLTLLSIQLII